MLLNIILTTNFKFQFERIIPIISTIKAFKKKINYLMN